MKWTRKPVFDYHEYHAERGEWSFCIDRKGRGWKLRGWKNGVFRKYEEGSSLKGLKAVAEEIK